MIKTVTKSPEAFTLKPSREMEELVIGLTKIIFLFIRPTFFLISNRCLKNKSRSTQLRLLIVL